MNVQTQRFGQIDVPEHAIIQFPDGILGFPQLRRGCLLPYQSDSPGAPEPILRWLQSLDDPSLLFLTVEPYLIFPDYDVELSDADAAALQLGSAELAGDACLAGDLGPEDRPCDAAVLTLITISQPPKAPRVAASPPRAAVTTNLLAPIVINTRTRRARQVILDNDRYLTKHIIGAQIEEHPHAGADPKTR